MIHIYAGLHLRYLGNKLIALKQDQKVLSKKFAINQKGFRAVQDSEL